MNSDRYRRLSPKELKSIGKSEKSRRYVLKTTKNITGKTKTISARQYENARITKETSGKATSKEQFTKKVKRNEVFYKTEKQKTAIQYRERTRHLRNEIEGLTSKDQKLIDKFQTRGGWKTLSDDEKKQWGKLFDKYPRTQVLDAIGSPHISVGRRAA
jgi:hypothetical protein